MRTNGEGKDDYRNATVSLFLEDRSLPEALLQLRFSSEYVVFTKYYTRNHRCSKIVLGFYPISKANAHRDHNMFIFQGVSVPRAGK